MASGHIPNIGMGEGVLASTFPPYALNQIK